MATRRKTMKLSDAVANVNGTICKLLTTCPFPVDPMSFYRSLMPPDMWGIISNPVTTEAMNFGACLHRWDTVQCCVMPTIEYRKARNDEANYQNVFWIELPEEVVTPESDTMTALNVDRGNIFYHDVMKWLKDVSELHQRVDAYQKKLDQFYSECLSVAEIAAVWPQLYAFTKAGPPPATPVSLDRKNDLTRFINRVFKSPFKTQFINDLTTASLLPEDVEAKSGPDWK